MDLCCGLVLVAMDCMILLLTSSGARGQFRPIKNPVYWGKWSDWSVCSSTCGQGVMSKSRDCLEWNHEGARTVEQWNCRGRARRQELCYGTDCDSTNSTKTRDECWSLNARGRIYFQHWEQVDVGSPCRIVCQEKNSGVQRTAEQLKDGTFCSGSQMEPRQCRGGKCVLISDASGCTDRDGNPGIMDMCLVCGGNNSSCIYLEGKFGHVQSLTGETNMIDRTGVRIPRGSTFIRVEKFGTASNTLALIDSYGRYVINGKSWQSKSGIYTAEGSKWTYGIEPSLETITTTGPTIGDVAFKLISFAPRQSVKFSFWGATHLHPHLATQWGIAWKSAPTSSDRRLESLDDVWWEQPPTNETNVNLVDVDIGQISNGETHLQLREEESVVYSISKRTTTTLTPFTTEEETVRPFVKTIPESRSGVQLADSKVDRRYTNIETKHPEVVESSPSEKDPKSHSPNRKDPSITLTPGIDVFSERNTKKPRDETKDNRKTKIQPNGRDKSSTKRKRKPRKQTSSGPKKEKNSKKRNGYRRRLRDSSFTLKPSEKCFSCPRAKARPKLYCASDFVSRVYVNRRKTVKQETRYDVTILSSYRNRVRLMQREFIWVESRCKCPNMRSKRTYIVMGNMKARTRTDRETRLVINKRSFVRGFSVGSDRRMQEMSRTVNCKS